MTQGLIEERKRLIWFIGAVQVVAQDTKRHGCSSCMHQKNCRFPWLQTDPEEAEQLEEEMLCDQTDADRALLKLFQDALKAGRFQRAHELAASMHLPRSLEGALKLTNFHR